MWRTLERELIDILRKQDAPLVDDGGDVVIIDNTGDVLFSVTELAKTLVDRGIGAPR